MYTSHFGFHLLPFENVPDPIFFFNQGQYNEILSTLMDSVNAGRGLTVLVGPIGSGKTTISQQIAAQFMKTTKLIWLAEPPDSFDELVALIAEEIGIETKDKTRVFLLRDIRARLLAMQTKSLRCLLIVDECHRMTKNVLEGIRVLTNLEKGASKLLQILLIGQEELLDSLKLEEMKALKQRVSTLRNLEQMDSDKTRKYILHRLQLAGGKPDTFSDHSLNMICLFAGGIPRVVNSFCHHSLRVTYESGQETVDPEHVHIAAQELDLEKETFHYLLKLNRSKNKNPSPESHQVSQDHKKTEDLDISNHDYQESTSHKSYNGAVSMQSRRVPFHARILLVLSILSLFISTWYYMSKSGL